MIIIKIAICGYKGKTGSKVYELLSDNNFDVIGIDRFDNLSNVIDKVDLLIDFTNVVSAINNINMCLKHNKPFIVGTTGFNKFQIETIKNKCHEKNIKGIICYNFSLPLNVILNQFDYFNDYFENINYIDVHHISKIDKESGTTKLFLAKNKNIKVKSLKSKKNSVIYIIQMINKYDKMSITYQVDDKVVFALGILHYLKTQDESLFINLLK